MSIQWTLAATFLYTEIAVVLLLVLPIASPKRWQSILKSRFLSVLGTQTQFYFYILLFSLVLLNVDAIREMRKYTNTTPSSDGKNQLDMEMQLNMKLFRAQRNFYISGFALFLSLVIRRLITLISSLAAMQASSEAALKQAQSATTAARTYLTAQTTSAENASNEAHSEEVSTLKNQVTDLKKELAKEKQDKDALKKQAEATNTEYDRLTAEFSKLQRKKEVSGSEDKKDD